MEMKPHLQNVERSRQARNREKYLCLDMNEGIVGIPAEILEKIKERIDVDFLYHYPSYDQLEERLAALAGVDAGRVCLTNGSDGAIKYLYDAFVSPGDLILHTNYTFAMYPVYTKIANAISRVVDYDDSLILDVSKFTTAIEESKPKFAVLVNPNNPSGGVLTKDEIRSIALCARINRSYLIVDEAYIVDQGESCVDLLADFDNIIVLGTFSKIYSIASARIGYIYASEYVIRAVRRVKPTFDVSGVSVLIAETLLEQDWVRKKIEEKMMEGKRYLTSALKIKNIPFIDCKGNFLLLQSPVDIHEAVAFFKQHGILVAGGFSGRLKRYLRITIGTEKQMELFFSVYCSLASLGMGN